MLQGPKIRGCAVTFARGINRFTEGKCGYGAKGEAGPDSFVNQGPNVTAKGEEKGIRRPRDVLRRPLWLAPEDGAWAPGSHGGQPGTSPATTRAKYLLKGQAKRLGQQKEVKEPAVWRTVVGGYGTAA